MQPARAVTGTRKRSAVLRRSGVSGAPGAQAQELVDVLNEFGVTECYYGHLHGKSIRYATQGERDGITYRLISADGLSFCPYKIR